MKGWGVGGLWKQNLGGHRILGKKKEQGLKNIIAAKRKIMIFSECKALAENF